MIDPALAFAEPPLEPRPGAAMVTSARARRRLTPLESATAAMLADGEPSAKAIALATGSLRADVDRAMLVLKHRYGARNRLDLAFRLRDEVRGTS
jgi:hypothetical protein